MRIGVAAVLMGLCAAPTLAQSPSPPLPAANPQPGRVVGLLDDVLVVDVSNMRMVAETRTRASTHIDALSGERHHRMVPYVVYKAVPEKRHLAMDLSTIRVTTPAGELLDPKTVDCLAADTPVVICEMPTLPKLWQDLLNDKTVVIFPINPGEAVSPPTVHPPGWASPDSTPWEAATTPSATGELLEAPRPVVRY